MVQAGREVQEDPQVLAAPLGLRVPEVQADREVPPLTWVSQEVRAGLEDLADPRYRADQVHREVREARRR